MFRRLIPRFYLVQNLRGDRYRALNNIAASGTTIKLTGYHQSEIIEMLTSLRRLWDQSIRRLMINGRKPQIQSPENSYLRSWCYGIVELCMLGDKSTARLVFYL